MTERVQRLTMSVSEMSDELGISSNSGRSPTGQNTALNAPVE